MSSWQSVETAPRDGTEFLAWFGNEYFTEYYLAHWLEPHGFYARGEDGPIEIKFWMHLPEIPK